MSSFEEQVRSFVKKVEVTSKAVFVNTASHALESIQLGSAVTGAPGQPVGQYGPGYHPGSVGGTLRNSWHLSYPSPTTASITTNIVYAPYIEDGVVPLGSRRGNATGHTSQRLTLRSTVGGFHSVQKTVDGLERIVAAETAKVNGRV